MPITFIDIERQKSWRISFLFLTLLALYFLMILALIRGFSLIFFLPLSGSGLAFFSTGSPSIGITLCFSLFMALMHFWFSASSAVQFVMRNLQAVVPDTGDGVHRMLKNIMDEIHIATGNRQKISCMVIPSFSMNALAAAGIKGESVIAITEGLLSRLTRPQLEAVLAHETYHILSGDCREATIATSLFGMYASAIEKIRNFNEEGRGLFHPAFLLFWILLKLGTLVSLFISREREYRADAASLRITRNPLAMAEALLILRKNWTGTGIISGGLEMLCITSPGENAIDQSGGMLADLFSTHPPIQKRIDILLRMAGISRRNLEQQMRSRDSRKLQPGKTLAGPVSSLLCPSCKVPLHEVSYEQTKVLECSSCCGMLVDNNRIPRVIVRRGVEFTDRQMSLAKAVQTDHQRRLSIERLTGAAGSLKSGMNCSKCGHPMFRTFYSSAYLVEIDRCNLCGFTWFDCDELEMLQYLIEQKTTVYIPLIDSGSVS